MTIRGKGAGSGLVAVSKLSFWGHVSVFKIPRGFVEPVEWNASTALSFARERMSWPMVAKSNTITEYGKDYLWRFALRAVSRTSAEPFHATATAEADDFITRMAVGDGATGPPDPSAFVDASDKIQSYRGRGRVVLSQDVDPIIVPHAVEVEARFDGTDITNPAIAVSPFDMNEAALVEENSDDGDGANPGNRVVAYCTFSDAPVPIAATDRVSVRWVVGIS